jgi:hypothetical protein
MEGENMWTLKAKRLDTVCSLCTSGVSIVCMSSMGAALAATGTAGGAGAVGMAGMGGMGTPSGGASAFLISQFFDRVGLDLLNQLPNAIAQPLLVTLLTLSLAASYLAYRGHRRLYTPALTLASSTAMYVSIYVWMSEALYFISLAGLLAAGIWSILLTRKPPGWLRRHAREAMT